MLSRRWTIRLVLLAFALATAAFFAGGSSDVYAQGIQCYSENSGWITSTPCQLAEHQHQLLTGILWGLAIAVGLGVLILQRPVPSNQD